MIDNPQDSESDDITSVTFHYLKTQGFRTTYAHGAAIGQNSRGEVVLSPYIERMPIPTQITHELGSVSVTEKNVQGTVGKVLSQVTREGVVRELDISIVFPPEVALQVARILTDKANETLESKKVKGENYDR